MTKNYIVVYDYDRVVGIHAKSDMDMIVKLAEYCHTKCDLFKQAASAINNVTSLIDLYHVFFDERINMFCETNPAFTWSDGYVDWIGDEC